MNTMPLEFVDSARYTMMIYKNSAILFIITDTQEDVRDQQVTVCCFVWLK